VLLPQILNNDRPDSQPRTVRFLFLPLVNGLDDRQCDLRFYFYFYFLFLESAFVTRCMYVSTKSRAGDARLVGVVV
jgi:hypothetical protein